MTPAEGVAAATINAAYALRREKTIGSLEVGKFADIGVFEVEDYREIPYYFGVKQVLDDDQARRDCLSCGRSRRFLLESARVAGQAKIPYDKE